MAGLYLHLKNKVINRAPGDFRRWKLLKFIVKHRWRIQPKNKQQSVQWHRNLKFFIYIHTYSNDQVQFYQLYQLSDWLRLLTSMSLYSNACRNPKSNSYIEVLLIIPECGYSCNLIIVSPLHLSSINDILDIGYRQWSLSHIGSNHTQTNTLRGRSKYLKKRLTLIFVLKNDSKGVEIW